ncbi:hypothetical protein RI129_012531 [Pyrocoelia pectoralis]|uniref:SGNH hydrolase-type esterase domain-containing protein n=1 Tax=Pyrocoelia pectoralis TaxID=417401 RepID=A0AAN7V3Z2_9COLE
MSKFEEMTLKSNICTIPERKYDVIGDNRWESMHERYVSEAHNSEAEVLFIGDSIIQQLQLTPLWNEKINPLHCLNFGIGGDRVENVLWRLLNGELQFSCTPKVIVLFVGTNNTGCTAQEVYDGICKIIEVITKELGDVKIVLPTLLPRGQHSTPNRERNMLVNELYMNNFDSVSANGNSINPNIHVVPIHEDIIQGDGSISHHLMHDYLHLTNEGYSKIFGPVYEKLYTLLNKTAKR